MLFTLTMRSWDPYWSISPSLACAVCKMSKMYGTGAEWPRVEQSYSGVEGVWQQKWRTTLALACVLCLDLLSHMWLQISRGLNCCQEFRRGVIYRLIGVRIVLKYKQGRLTNGCRVSSNYTTYILVSPSCNIPTNNILISSVVSCKLAWDPNSNR